MAYDRGYRREQERGRGRDVDYGWGVPIRGMYSYSLEYGGLAGPESEDSETIPPYESGRPDWTGPRPRYERDHWAAAEPAGERRYREEARGRGGHARELRRFRSALEAARARAEAGYGADYGQARRGGGAPGPQQARPRDGWPGAARRGASFGPGRDFGWAARSRVRAGWAAAPGYGGDYGRGRDRYGDEYGRTGGYGDEYRRSGARGERGYGRGPSSRPVGRDYPGYRFRDEPGGEARGRGEWAQGYDPAREGPRFRSRGPRGRWGPYGGRVAPGGD